MQWKYLKSRSTLSIAPNTSFILPTPTCPHLSAVTGDQELHAAPESGTWFRVVLGIYTFCELRCGERHLPLAGAVAVQEAMRDLRQYRREGGCRARR